MRVISRLLSDPPPQDNMKSFVLLCLLAAAVHAENAEQNRLLSWGTGSVVAEANSQPWTVHIRRTINTRPYLETCVGSMIHERVVLTSARCVTSTSFAWLRFGVSNVNNPETVIETSTTRIHGIANIGFFTTNTRTVHYTANIQAVPLLRDAVLPAPTTQYCSFGAFSTGGGFNYLTPGTILRCIDVTLEIQDENIIATSTQGSPTKFDEGSALVVDGYQVGLLVDWPKTSGNNTAVFLRTYEYIDWINQLTDLDLGVWLPYESEEDFSVVDVVTLPPVDNGDNVVDVVTLPTV